MERRPRLGADPHFRTWITAGRLNGISVYSSAVALGASDALANAAQAGAMLLAAASVYWSFRRPMSRELRLAILLSATILAAPHVSDSDAMLLGWLILSVIARERSRAPSPPMGGALDLALR